MQIISRWLLITLLCTLMVACGGNDEATLNTLEADTEGSVRFQLDAWADNWFAAYLGEQLLVEDSVSITTERYTLNNSGKNPTGIQNLSGLATVYPYFLRRYKNLYGDHV